MSSALCLIDGGHLYYRGQDAVELSRTARFEDVAALLWGGPCGPLEPLPHPGVNARRALGRLDFASAGVAHLASIQARDTGAGDLEPASVRATGGRVLAELTALASGFEAGQGSIAERLRDAFGARARRARRAIEAALILCADHELNASAFAARVIAATGATPYMAVIGALGALSGRRHGGMTEPVTRLLEARVSPSEALSRARSVVANPSRALVTPCIRMAIRARRACSSCARRTRSNAEPSSSRKRSRGRSAFART